MRFQSTTLSRKFAPDESGGASFRIKERWFQSMSRREAAWVAAGSLLFSIVFLYPMLCEVGYLGPGISGWISTGPELDHLRRFPSNGDWDLFTQLRWVPYYTIAHFHQIPFWNPYKCGGMGMLSNPESSVVSPFLIPYLLFGQPAGLYVEIVIHLAMAISGGYVLARAVGLGRIAAIVSAVVFPSSSWLYLHLSVGHLNFLPALYIPWIVALFLISIDRRKLFPAALGGLLCALTLTEGNYTFLYTAIIIGSLALVLALVNLSIWPAISGLVIGLFGLGFSALKLIPMSQQLTIYPKIAFGLEAISPRLLAVFLFSRQQDLYHPSGAEFLFSEYGAYISSIFAALAVIGLVCRPIKTLPWLLPAVIFFLFAQGYTGGHSPVLLIRFLPLSASAGLTGRYLIPFVFCVGVIAANGTDFLSSKFEPWGKSTAILLLTLGIVDSWLVGAPNARYLFHNDIERVEASRDFRQYWVANPGIQTEIAQANMGSVNCQGYGYNDIPENPLGYNQTGYRGENYLLGPGEVNQILWTPNRLRYEVNVSVPSSLVINQNYYPGWRLRSGNGELYAQNGLIAVRIPPGRNRIELVYAPEHILLAFALTMAALAALILIWRKETQN
jgi:hypothetical protein